MAPRSSAAEIPSGDDERLLIEAAKADPRRFAELYERNFDRVYAFAARRAGSRSEAEDVTAEVFHQALANLHRFEWRGVPFAAWLLQIARNTVTDRWQRRTRERGEPLPEPADDGRPADADHRAMLADLAGRLPRDQQRGAPALIEFLKQAFAAEEMEIHREPAGTVVHAKIRVGGSVIEMGEAHGEWEPMPTMFYVYVDDVDAWYRRALAAGATSMEAPALQPYGDRRAAVRDAFDNQWYLAAPAS